MLTAGKDLHNTKRNAQPFRIEISFSKMQAVCIVGVHILAVLALAMAVIPIIIKFTIIICILLSFIMNWHQIQFSKHCQLLHTASGAWQIGCNNKITPIHILSESVITPMVIFLYFEKKSLEKQSMLIFKDAVSHEAFRILTVALKIHCFND